MDEKLLVALTRRRTVGTLRTLHVSDATAAAAAVDFYSNDYLSFARSQALTDLVQTRHRALQAQHGYTLGATGSRLISGNSKLFMQVEKDLATFYHTYVAVVAQ